MNKRLEKLHKRKVARAKDKIRLSEPDLRTPEQIAAAREISRSVPALRHDPHALYSPPAAGPAAEEK